MTNAAGRSRWRILFGWPRTSGEWIWLAVCFSVPVVALIVALNPPGRGSEMGLDEIGSLVLALGGGTLLGVVLSVAGARRGVPCTIPCALFSLLLIPALVWIKDNEVTAWSDSRIQQFAALPDGRTILWGPAVVTLGPNSEVKRYESREFEPELFALSDGRVLAQFPWGIEDLGSDGRWPFSEGVLQVAAGPSGSVQVATRTMPGAAVLVTSYSPQGLMERSWTLENPKGTAVQDRSSGDIVLFSDGVAAITRARWEGAGVSEVAFYGPDGALLPHGTAELGCEVHLTASRDGSVFIMPRGGCGFALLRIQRDGRASTQFAPDQTALGKEMSILRTVLELPDGSVVFGGQHSILKLDAWGRSDPNFACRFQGPLEQMALQGDKIMVLEGGRVRRFLRDGREDPSFRVPALETKFRKRGETRVKTRWPWLL